MNTVDVIFEPEQLPRMRLLQSHMRKLQIDLQLHEDMPHPHSERVIYVPKAKDSRFAKSPKGPDFERIALYLDDHAENIEAEMAVSLSTWPGRSSDEAVARLAGYLHRPFTPLEDARSGSSKTRSKKARPSNRSNSSERRNNIILGVIALGLLAAFLLTDATSERSPEQAKSLDNEPSVGIETGLPPSQTTTAEFAMAAQQNRIRQDQNGQANASILKLAAPSANQSAPNFLTAQQTSYPTFTLCAGPNDLLRNKLYWEPYSDQNPCQP